MTGEDKKQNKRIQVHVALVLELETEEKIVYNPSKEFYISDLFCLVQVIYLVYFCSRCSML